MAYSPGPYKHVAVEGGRDGVECERDGLLCRLVYNNPDNADLFAVAPELADALRAVLRQGLSCQPNCPSERGNRCNCGADEVDNQVRTALAGLGG